MIGTVGVPITLAFRIDSLSISSDEPFVGATTPDDGGSAGSGPWTATDIQRMIFKPALSLLITRPFGLGTTVAPFPNVPAHETPAPVPVAFELRREGGNPGTGSRALIDFGGVAVGNYADNFSITSPGCEVEGSWTDRLSVRRDELPHRGSRTSGSRTSGALQATQSGTVVPEPSTGLLLGMGLAGFAARAGRRSAALACAA